MLLVLSSGLPAGAQEARNPAVQQLQETADRLNALDKWFNEAEQKRSVWLVDLQRQDRAIASLGNDVVAIRTALIGTDEELTTLSKEQQQLQAQREKQATYIAQHISAAYRLNGQDFLKQLLNQESPDDLDRTIRYHRYFSESRLAIMSEYQSTLTAIQNNAASLTVTRTQQEEQRLALEQEQRSLGDERKSRATLIASLDIETESKTEEYDRLEKDRIRLEQLIAELTVRASRLDGDAFKKARGQLPMPVSGRIRHAFGARRADGRLRWHGIDIDASHGTPITAVFRGRVVFADWLRGFGFLTIVDHGGDYMTLYGHVDALHKKVGDLVESGETIASAGNSGGRMDPGVYFEIRHAGKPKDPISWVARR